MNIVVVSDEQRRDSAVCIHVSVLHQTPLPSRMPCDMGRVPYVVQGALDVDPLEI